MTSHLGLPQALGCFLLKSAGIVRGTATWHLWTIVMATAGQVFYFGHCLGVVLPRILLSNVMSSLLYSFPPCTDLAKAGSLSSVFLQYLEKFALRCLKYETFCASVQQSESETVPEREGASRIEGQ